MFAAAVAMSLALTTPSAAEGWCFINCAPSDAGVREAFTDLTAKAFADSGARYEIKSFKVVDHQDLQSSHRVSYKAEIAFPVGYQSWKPGEVWTIENGITFEKTSRGWVFQGKPY